MSSVIRVRLTDAKIAALEAPQDKSAVFSYDSIVGGLAVKTTVTGSKSFALIYRAPGRKRQTKLKLGGAEIGIAEARRLARLHLGGLAAGIDPMEERRAAKRDAEEGDQRSIRARLDAFQKHERERGLAKVAERMSSLHRGLAPHMDAEPDSLTRTTLVELLDEAKAKRGPGARGDLRKHLNVFMGWCVERGYILANPLAGHREPRKTREQLAREADKRRAYSDEELVAIWKACEARRGPFADLVRAVLLTGLRRGELALLERSAIEEGSDRSHWIEFERRANKSGHEFAVYVAPQLKKLLDARPLTSSPLLFPSTRTGGPISGWQKGITWLREETGIEDLKLHGLRRTFRTGLSRLGVQTEVAEFCLNHQQTELLKLYNFHLPRDRMKEAWLRWDSHVSGLLSPYGMREVEKNGEHAA